VTPRLIATDLDGTIVRSDGKISDRTREALGAAEAAGLVVVFVTGRPPRWMKEVAEQTGHAGVAICANGALVFDLHTETLVREHPMQPEDAMHLVREMRAALPDIVFAVERGLQFAHEPAYVPRVELPPDVTVAEMEELLSVPVVKVLARHTTMGPAEMIKVAQEVIGDLASLVEVTFGATAGGLDGLLEISAAGVTKGFALEHLAAEHGLGAADVIAFGDMPNDLPMLAWAGHAVAVANAHPDVLAIADEVTESNDDDGVALVIERILAAHV
jgi:Cof subfamily protein (haloacid dehalogenase superfamily)